MKKSMPTLERLFAVVLILAMILSLVPAGAFARESAKENVNKLSATLVRETVEVQSGKAEPADFAVGTPETTGVSAEPAEEPAEPMEAAAASMEIVEPMAETFELYNYKLTVKVNDEDVPFHVEWFGASDEVCVGAQATSPGVLENREEDNIYAKVTYDGIELKVALPDTEDECTVTVEPVKQDWNGNVTVGAPFTLGYDLKAGYLQGLKHTRTISNPGYLKRVDSDTYYAPMPGKVTIIDTWTSASGRVYAKAAYEVQAGYPSAKFSVDGSAGSNGWYGTGQTVTVKAGGGMGMVSSEGLPKVTVGTVSYENWVKNEEDGGYDLTVTLNESGTVYYAEGTSAEASYELKIDTVKPTAEICRFFPGSVQYRVTTGPSGLASVSINDAEVDISKVEGEDQGNGTITYEGWCSVDAADSVKIVAVNGAGISSESAFGQSLNVKFTDVDESGLIWKKDNHAFLKDGKQSVCFEIENWYEGLEVKCEALDQDGGSITVEPAGGSGTVLLANGLSNLKVIVTDPNAPGGGRSAEYSYDKTYKYDRTPPKVTVTRDREPVAIRDGTEYFNKAVTYTFQIEDALWEAEDFRVEYRLDGSDEVKIAEVDANYRIPVTVGDGERLKSMTVYGKDKTGNAVEKVLVTDDNPFTWGEGTTHECDVVADAAPPKATATISDNVKLFYTNNELSFAVLNQEGPDTVTLTITVQDDNLDPKCVEGWTEAGENTYTKDFTAEVGVNGTGVLKYEFQVRDIAGWSVDGITVAATGSKEGYATSLDLAGNTKGTYKGDILIDRRPPSSDYEDAPKVYLELEGDVTPGKTADGKELFAGIFVYKMRITDQSKAGYDSGVKNVNCTLDYTLWDNCKVENAVTVDKELLKDDDPFDDSYDYEITVTPEKGVEANVKLKICLEDYAGNSYSYSEDVVVDTLAPRIDLSYDNTDCSELVDNEGNTQRYYKSTRTATITITDMNPDDDNDKILVNNDKNEKYEKQDDGSYQVPFMKGGEYTLSISAKDAAGNESDPKEDAFTIDTTKPEIKVELLPVDDKTPVAKCIGNVVYYNAPIKLRVTIADVNLDKGGVAAAKVSYTTENGGKKTINLDDNWQSTRDKDGRRVYSTEIELKDGDVLTGLCVSARDNANNEAGEVQMDEGLMMNFTAEEKAAESPEPTKFNIDRKLVVDARKPEVTVTKTVTADSYIQTFNGNAYYNQPVTYSFVVEDQFLDLDLEDGGSIKIKAIYTDGTTDEYLELEPEKAAAAPAEQADKELLSAVDTYAYKFEVVSGKWLKGIDILVKDNLGWGAEEIGVVISNLESNEETSSVKEPVTTLTTAFAKDEESEEWSYTGEPIIVDTDKPEVEVAFSRNVKSFYTKADDSDTIYVILEDPAVSAAELEVTFTVKDKNLTLDPQNFYVVNPVKSDEQDENPIVWAGELGINKESKLTLADKTAQIETNKVGNVEVAAKVVDLSGNPAKEFVIKTADKSTNTVTPDENGCFARNFVLDRRKPTSTSEDNAPPVIEIKPSIEPVKTADGKDLFSKSFSYTLDVNDGSDVTKNAGLKAVTWTVTDDNGVVKAVNGVKNFETQEMTWNNTIPVEFAKTGESNEVTIVIKAVDNVGNTITYSDTIGVDNLAPRVNVTKSNSDVKNDFYFKANQDISVTIEDLNFNGKTSTVETQVSPRVPAWKSLGENRYGITLAYHSDGDYTFDMASTDLAGNTATVDIEKVLQKFTIDKTAPVIHVAFDPSLAIGTDGAGVQYFDKNRTVTLTITEHNFRAGDVTADLGAANALGGWSSRGDTHSAAETFTEGNNYHVNVNYVDLAGNPAQSYSSPNFSVDLGAPTITMTTGDLDMGRLNIIPDDLLLGFTIQDEENNLKNFNAEVRFLDRNYVEHRVEGAAFYTVSGQGDRTVGYVNFANIARTKDNDGIYTIRLYAEDYAGHVVDMSPALTMSLNRFGSSFLVDDAYTKEFLMPDDSGIVYRDEVTGPLVIKEINPTQVWQDAEHTVSGSVITIAVNGKSITLEEGVHYDLSTALKGDSSGKWYEYTYSIYPEVFLENGELVDGEYAIFFYSADEAGNQNSNETNADALLQMDANGTYSGKISFVLDHQPPVVTILGVKDGDTSFDTNRQVEINISDNTPAAIEIYINGELVELITLADGADVTSDWFYYDEESGSYYLNISGKKAPQDLKVVVTDAVGNRIEQEVKHLMLTDDLLAQYVNSVPAIMISVVLLVVLSILIVVLLKKRKKRSEKTLVKA